ncbi:hypothetical protein [Dyella acidisoli]|uniref:Uncharacterized protein n=1 Tax=Dyella acidisoli TaxID=1867834 RepID=A0ABQ5XPD5_9GAMM|nr:hypothetical protein [Dyella acidisoli]GLQ93592.1 hypothetical protein GCM10007901_25430 [Dyella acidisoli]
MTSITDVLIPVVSSGLTAGIVTFVLNTRQQERAMRRGKLEELTSILSRQMIMLKNQVTYLEALVAGRITNDEFVAYLEKDGAKEIPHDRVQALITIYFPALLPEVERLFHLESAMQQQESSDGKIRLNQIHTLFAARNGFFASVLAQAPSVNVPLWKIWR